MLASVGATEPLIYLNQSILLSILSGLSFSNTNTADNMMINLFSFSVKARYSSLLNSVTVQSCLLNNVTDLTKLRRDIPKDSNVSYMDAPILVLTKATNSNPDKFLILASCESLSKIAELLDFKTPSSKNILFSPTKKSSEIKFRSFFSTVYFNLRFYFKILETTPAPTVWPPSRIAKRRPSFIAIG